MAKKMSLGEFLEKSKKVHNDKYDYSLVVDDYKNSKSVIRIICPIHGEFTQRVGGHSYGYGCVRCGTSHPHTPQKKYSVFFEKAISVHGDKYDYSLAEIDILEGNDNIRIICPTHGENVQTMNGHLNGHGCTPCGYDNNSKVRRKTKAEFIDDGISVHGDIYDYSLVEYVNSREKVKIVCSVHGEFLQSPNHHLKGRGCPVCANDNNSIHALNKKRHDDIKNNFVKKAKGVHGDDFEYLTEYVDSYTKIEIMCNTCGLEFKQKPHNHLSGNGCPHCLSSKGERLIRKWLIENNIEYEQEKWFDECRGKVRPLPFDFWIPSKNLLIEFQGRQHYEPVNFRNGLNEEEMLRNFDATLTNDSIKREFCINSNIELLEIPYKDMNKIDNILNNNIGE